jgi:integrase
MSDETVAASEAVNLSTTAHAPKKRRGPRGEGRIFQRGSIWYVAYCRNGHEIRESADTTDESKARKILRQRIEDAKKPEFVGPKEKRLDLEDLERKLEADYIRHGRRSWSTVKDCLKAVKAFFAYDRLLEITPLKVEAYQDHRLKQGKARATVNREVRYLLHGYKLLFDSGEISYVPRVKLLEGENVREGFINRPEFDVLCEHLNDDNRDIVQFLYLSAWRSGEPKSLEWPKVDMNDGVIRLSRKNDKTKRPRTLALVGELREIIERRLAKRLPFCNLVFHRDGKPIKSFRRQWQSAAVAAGLGCIEKDKVTGKERYTGITPHDMRRSAIRNLMKAGVSEAVGMSISGHKTNSTYKRYGIIDEDIQRAALEQSQEHQQREIEQRKVVPIRKAG